MTWTAPGAKQGVIDLQHATAQAKVRPDIEWTDAPAGSSCARRVFPARYKEPPNVDPKIAERFVVGVPVMAARELGLSHDRGTYQFAPLDEFDGEEGEVHVAKGTLMVYAGPVYEQERQYVNGRYVDVNAIKHTFITPLGRCIIHDFNLIELL